MTKRIQHINFPTHIQNLTLNLIITTLLPLLFFFLLTDLIFVLNIKDHYLMVADLKIEPFLALVLFLNSSAAFKISMTPNISKPSLFP